jgi:hypothetical protein
MNNDAISSLNDAVSSLKLLTQLKTSNAFFPNNLSVKTFFKKPHICKNEIGNKASETTSGLQSAAILDNKFNNNIKEIDCEGTEAIPDIRGNTYLHQRNSLLQSWKLYPALEEILTDTKEIHCERSEATSDNRGNPISHFRNGQVHSKKYLLTVTNPHLTMTKSTT